MRKMSKFLGSWIILGILIPLSKAYSFSPILLARWTYTGSNSPIEVYWSTNGGVSWTLRGIPDYADMDPSIGDFGIGICATPSKSLGLVALTEGYNGNPWKGARFYFSKDTGATWEHRGTLTTNAINNCNSAGILGFSEDTFYVYLVGASSTSKIDVYKSTNGGYGWSQTASFSVTSGGDDMEGEMCYTGEKYFIGDWTSTSSDPYCWSSIDGISWSSPSMIVDGQTSGQNMRSVGIVSLRDTLYATIQSNAMTLGLYKSTNQGNTWNFVTTVFNQVGTNDGTQSIGIDADGYFYVAAWDSDQNTLIFRSDNQGNNWNQVGDVPPFSHSWATAVSFTPLKTQPAGCEENGEKEREGLLDCVVSQGDCLFQYNLATPGFVELKIYDVVGRYIATPVSDFQTKGTHIAHWKRGKWTGIYFYHLQIGASVTKGKLLILSR